MLNLYGAYPCKLDNKGRVPFPAKLRKQLDEVIHHGLMCNKDVFKPCLVLYPKAAWDKVYEDMSKLNPYIREEAAFKRRFMGAVTRMDPDSVGRIVLTPLMLEGIRVDLKQSNEVLFVGNWETIEVWNPELYKKEMNGENEEDDIETMSNKLGRILRPSSGTNPS
jgi:MraZ protein